MPSLFVIHCCDSPFLPGRWFISPHCNICYDVAVPVTIYFPVCLFYDRLLLQRCYAFPRLFCCYLHTFAPFDVVIPATCGDSSTRYTRTTFDAFDLNICYSYLPRTFILPLLRSLTVATTRFILLNCYSRCTAIYADVIAAFTRFISVARHSFGR